MRAGKCRQWREQRDGAGEQGEDETRGGQSHGWGQGSVRFVMAVSWHFIPNVLGSRRRVRLGEEVVQPLPPLSGPDASVADLIRAPTEGCFPQSSVALPRDDLCHLIPLPPPNSIISHPNPQQNKLRASADRHTVLICMSLERNSDRLILG